MAARELVEDESVLSLGKIRELFNQFCRPNAKLVNSRSIEPWILHRDAKQRLFGIAATRYRGLAATQRTAARESAVDRFNARFDSIFQRRHDCIHNCDRPRVGLQAVSDTSVRKVVDDVEFLVGRCHEVLSTEFTAYLGGLGFNRQTQNRVCM